MIHITTHGDLFAIRSPFEAKDAIKALPGARWNAGKRVWTMPATRTAADNLVQAFDGQIVGDQGYLEKLERIDAEPTFSDLTTTPWGHQTEAIKHGMAHEGALLAMHMGTGKSLCAVAIACETARRVLILCPLSVVAVWPSEFKKHSGQAFQVLALDHGSSAKRADQAEQYAKLREAYGDRWAIVVNYESAVSEQFAKWALAQQWDLVILDESHRLKMPGGKRSIFVKNLARRATRRLALTGTPMPHSPLDIYAQYRALDQGVFGTSFVKFRAQYAVMGGYGQYQVVAWQNQVDFAERFRSIAYEASADVLDLPEAMHVERTCELAPKARRAYSGLEDDFYAEVEAGEITAANALVKLLRLQQITGGDLPLDSGEMREIDTRKSDLLADVIEDIDEPIVVICRFRGDLDRVRRVAEASKRTYGEISGRSKDGLDGHTMADVDVVGVQIQAGGVGIDLTRARYCIFYSLGFSLGDYDQVCARVHRPGQTRPVTYVHLICEQTVDRQVYGALQARRDVIDTILGARK